MTLIFQDAEGEITELLNRSIEQIICIDGVAHKNRFTNIILVWLKIEQEKYWYRIFFDAGLCFFSRYHYSEFLESYAEDIDNSENCPVYQIDLQFELRGLTISSAFVYPTNSPHGIEFKIFFNNGDYLIMQGINFDSDISLSIIKA